MKGVNLTLEHDRKSFLFYGSYLDAVDKLKSGNDKLELFYAIARYGLDQKKPKFDSELAEMAWVFIEPLLNANYQNYINGSKGGAPVGNKNAKKTTQNNPKQPKNNPKQGNVNEKDNVNDNVKDNVNANVNANDNVNVNEKEESSFSDEGWIPYKDENGNWVVAGEEG